MIPMWLLFGVESFLKPSKVTSLKSPHTWLFLKEARLDAWPRVGVNVYQLPLHKLCPLWFWTTKKKSNGQPQSQARGWSWGEVSQKAAGIATLSARLPLLSKQQTAARTGRIRDRDK